MLHYDQSTTDAGAVAWLRDDPRAKVSYNWLVLDDGTVHAIAPLTARAWHAGVCRPSDPERMPYTDANSAFYGLSIAAGNRDKATEPQLKMVVQLCAALVRLHRWGKNFYHITGHEFEAWPRGRKVDPGEVMSVAVIRDRVEELLLRTSS